MTSLNPPDIIRRSRGTDRNFLQKGRSYGKGWAGGKRFLTIPLSRPILPPLHYSLLIKSFPCPTQEPLERAAGVPQRARTGPNGPQRVPERPPVWLGDDLIRRALIPRTGQSESTFFSSVFLISKPSSMKRVFFRFGSFGFPF